MSTGSYLRAAAAGLLATIMGCHTYIPPKAKDLARAEVAVERSYGSLDDKVKELGGAETPGADYAGISTAIMKNSTDAAYNSSVAKLIDSAKSNYELNKQLPKALAALIEELKHNKNAPLDNELLVETKKSIDAFVESAKDIDYQTVYQTQSKKPAGASKEIDTLLDDLQSQRKRTQEYIEFFADLCAAEGFWEAATTYDALANWIEGKRTGCSYTEAAKEAFESDLSVKDEFLKAVEEIKKIEKGQPNEFYLIAKARNQYMSKVFGKFSGTGNNGSGNGEKSSLSAKEETGQMQLFDAALLELLRSRADYNQTWGAIQCALPIVDLAYTAKHDLGHLGCKSNPVLDDKAEMMRRVRYARIGATGYEGWHPGQDRNLLRFVLITAGNVGTALSIGLAGSESGHDSSAPGQGSIGGGQQGGGLIRAPEPYIQPPRAPIMKPQSRVNKAHRQMAFNRKSPGRRA